jgi:hypothetical protein
LPVLLSSVYRPDPSADGLWKSFRNDPGQGSDNGPKSDRLEIGMLTGMISESRPPWSGIRNESFGLSALIRRIGYLKQSRIEQRGDNTLTVDI